MPIEQRGTARYFYRSERRDGRVRRVYYGRGQLAEVLAALETLVRQAHAELQTARQAAVARSRAAEASEATDGGERGSQAV